MTPRERNLAIVVGSLAVLFVLNLGLRRMFSSLHAKEDRVDAALSELTSLHNTIRQGTRASDKIGQWTKKSLPSDPEEAADQYKNWLSDVANHSGMTQISVSKSPQVLSILPPGYPAGTPKVYDVHEFTLGGQCTTEQALALVGDYYDRDYLHQISSLALVPVRGQSNFYTLDLTSRVLSLARAEAKKQPSKEPSGRLAMTIDGYKQKILQRNPLAPPNQPPKFTTAASHNATLGQSWQLNLEASDPDGNDVLFELVTDPAELPETLTFENSQLRWNPIEKGEQKLVVRAVDNGWPRQSTELALTLKAIDAPVAEKPKTTPTLDPAKQAFLTGLVTGRSGAQGWIRSKAEGLSIDIFEGAEINIGSITATVVSIHIKEDYIELETDGTRWTVDMNTSLAEAYENSQVD